MALRLSSFFGAVLVAGSLWLDRIVLTFCTVGPCRRSPIAMQKVMLIHRQFAPCRSFRSGRGSWGQEFAAVFASNLGFVAVASVLHDREPVREFIDPEIRMRPDGVVALGSLRGSDCTAL
jgi:hypothetical protein